MPPMPLYDYACTACDTAFDAFRPMAEAGAHGTCPRCGAAAARAGSPPRASPACPGRLWRPTPPMNAQRTNRAAHPMSAAPAAIMADRRKASPPRRTNRR
ncbi:zinc ribbon domain-containing protein [Tistrella bauzanensis]